MFVPIVIDSDNIGWAINANIQNIEKELAKKLSTEVSQSLSAPLDLNGATVSNVGSPTTPRSAVTFSKFVEIYPSAL